jgi:putative transcriptional regulator
LLLRAEKKWTQKQVATLLGVSRQTINSIEANKYNPSLILAYKIALLFDKDISEIFHYITNEKEEK